jgi:HSP20 family protein
MTLMKWDPFKDLLSLQDKINRLFEDSLTKIHFRDNELSFGAWSPPVDMYETGKNIVVKMELPGMAASDFNVSVHSQNLVVKGERKFKKDVKQEKFHRVERVYGAFQRILPLPDNVDTTHIEAKFSNGVLEISIPKAEKEKTKQFKIEVE